MCPGCSIQAKQHVESATHVCYTHICVIIVWIIYSIERQFTDWEKWFMTRKDYLWLKADIYGLEIISADQWVCFCFWSYDAPFSQSVNKLNFAYKINLLLWLNIVLDHFLVHGVGQEMLYIRWLLKLLIDDNFFFLLHSQH